MDLIFLSPFVETICSPSTEPSNKIRFYIFTEKKKQGKKGQEKKEKEEQKEEKEGEYKERRRKGKKKRQKRRRKKKEKNKESMYLQNLYTFIYSLELYKKCLLIPIIDQFGRNCHLNNPESSKQRQMFIYIYIYNLFNFHFSPSFLPCWSLIRRAFYMKKHKLDEKCVYIG